MKRLVLVAVISAALFGLTACDQNKTTAQAAPEQASIVPEPVKADHYYSLKDGYEYGYEQGVSQNSTNEGQVASTLLMFKFAGEKDGIYQAYAKNAMGAFDVVQCTNPCDFFKEMIFFNGEHIKTERIKAVEGSIGWSVMADAINGKLEQYVGMNSVTRKKVNVWFDEQNGMKGTPVGK